MPYQVINGDSTFELESLNDESVDLVICSPPYKNEDGFSRWLITDIFTQLYRVLKNNSLCFVNFGHLAGFKSRPFEVALLIESVGFELEETFVWVKNHYKPIQGKRRVNNLTEFVFMFSVEGKMPELDRLSIGVPYADPSNAKRFNNGNNLKCAGNVWPIKYETIQKSEQKTHNDRFPVELPLRCIKLSGIAPGSTVLDPFSGSATTGVAALQLGMNYIGIEKNIEHYNNSLKRLNQASQKV